MPVVISVSEFKKEGFAIVEDTEGKFLMQRDSAEIVPLHDPKKLVEVLTRKSPCALLQSRDRMMT